MKKTLWTWLCIFLLGLVIFVSLDLYRQPIAQLSGFEVKKDGFKFPNYPDKLSDIEVSKDLEPATMKLLFGPIACSKEIDTEDSEDSCVLTPPFQIWMDQTNNKMKGGHCEGMAVLSLFLYQNRLNGAPSNFPILKAKTSNAYSLEKSEEVQREIAFWYATQFTLPTKIGEDFSSSHKEFVKKLKESMGNNKDQLYTIGIYSKEGGHLITPFKIEKRGIFRNKEYIIYNYDSDVPGRATELHIPEDEEKRIIYDANSYWNQENQSNHVSPSPFRGRYWSTRHGSLKANDLKATLVSTTLRKEQQNTPFSIGDNQIWVEGNGSLHITNLQGAKINPESNPCSSSEQNCIYEQSTNFSPIYRISGKPQFRLTVESDDVKKESETSVSIIGKDYYFSTRNIKLGSDQENAIIELDERDLVYKNKTSIKQSLAINAGFAVRNQADYDFKLSGISVDPKGQLNFHLGWSEKPSDPDQFVSLSSPESQTEIETIEMTRQGEDGELGSWCSSKITLQPAQTLRIEHGKIQSSKIDQVPIQLLKDGNQVGEIPLSISNCT